MSSKIRPAHNSPSLLSVEASRGCAGPRALSCILGVKLDQPPGCLAVTRFHRSSNACFIVSGGRVNVSHVSLAGVSTEHVTRRAAHTHAALLCYISSLARALAVGCWRRMDECRHHCHRRRDAVQAERLAREGTKASVDLDQVRADSQLMELMDESIYDD